MSSDSIIPTLGMTFTEAFERWARLHEEERTAEASGRREEAWERFQELDRIPPAMVQAEPHTTSDAMALLAILASPATTIDSATVPLAVERARIILLRALEAGQHDAHTVEMFVDTIAAFDGAASGPLCLPHAPTEAMLAAGAAVAGSTQDQVQAMYAAMADAYRKERAA